MNLITEVKLGLYLGGGEHVIFETDEFNKLNIGVIFNCCDEICHEANNKYIINHFLIRDDGEGDNFCNYMDEIVDKIDYYLSRGSNIYVHCVQGVSRSAAIIIYYCMKYEKSSFDKAYNRLFMMRPCISPHINFIKELKKKDMHKLTNSGGFKNRFSDI